MPDHAHDVTARYQATTGQPLPEDRFAFGDTPALATELAHRVLDGHKTATSSLWLDYDDAPLPQAGDRSVVLDGHDEPVCVIETIAVRTLPFDEVDADFAAAEGEGDGTLSWWRTEHERFFRARCQTHGVAFTTDIAVVCERFRVAWPLGGT